MPSKANGGVRAVVMVNNLGGLSKLELVTLVPFVLASLTHRKIETLRFFIGTSMSSLDVPGLSIAALGLPETDADTILKGVDPSSSAPGWRPCSVPVLKPEPSPASRSKTEGAGPSGLTASDLFFHALEQGAKGRDCVRAGHYALRRDC